MVPRVGLLWSHHIQVARLVAEERRPENHDDGGHPIIGEPLGRFVADDVRNTRRPGTDLRWRREVLVLGYNEPFAYGGVLSGKNSAGVGVAEGNGVGELSSGALEVSLDSLAVSTCSFCASGISPR